MEKGLSDSCSTSQINYSTAKKEFEAVNSRVSSLEQTTQKADEDNLSRFSDLEAKARKTKEYAASLLVAMAGIE